MRRIFGLMISTGSLAAFSASAAPGLASLRGATPADAAAPLRVATGPAPTQQGAARPPISLSPGQILPRGSLLDLRV